MTGSRALAALLQKYPEDVRALAIAGRALILDVIPGAEEGVDTTSSTVSYGFGPGYKGMICTLILSKSGVKLGLVRGAELADPARLLAGSGKTHKYVQLRRPGDLKNPAVKTLVQAAHAAWTARQA